MKKYHSKPLSDSIKNVFSSKHQQILLTKITKDELFFPFLCGNHEVQVLTPLKEAFVAKIKHIENTSDEFILTTVKSDAPPLLAPNDALILLFNLPRGAYVSQAKITDFKGSEIKVIAVDPRVHTRFKTRVPVTFFTINEQLFDQLKSLKVSVRRVIEYADPKNLADPRQCRDFLVVPPVDSLDPVAHLAATEEVISGLMADISLGGCCLCVAPNIPIAAIRSRFFIFIEIALPTLEKRTSASVFAVVRHIRQGKQWTFLHCMFLEPLPQEMLLLPQEGPM